MDSILSSLVKEASPPRPVHWRFNVATVDEARIDAVQVDGSAGRSAFVLKTMPISSKQCWVALDKRTVSAHEKDDASPFLKWRARDAALAACAALGCGPFGMQRVAHRSVRAVGTTEWLVAPRRPLMVPLAWSVETLGREDAPSTRPPRITFDSGPKDTATYEPPVVQLEELQMKHAHFHANEALAEAIVPRIIESTIRALEARRAEPDTVSATAHICGAAAAWHDVATGTTFILQKRCGETLMGVMRRNALSREHLRATLAQVFVAMSAASIACRAKHMDLHIGNVFLDFASDWAEEERGAPPLPFGAPEWRYAIANNVVTLRRTDVIARIGDWGFSSATLAVDGTTARISRGDFRTMDAEKDAEFGPSLTGDTKGYALYDFLYLLGAIRDEAQRIIADEEEDSESDSEAEDAKKKQKNKRRGRRSPKRRPQNPVAAGAIAFIDDLLQELAPLKGTDGERLTALTEYGRPKRANSDIPLFSLCARLCTKLGMSLT